MENEIIRTVLTEILDELKGIRDENLIKEKSVEELKVILRSVEEKITSAKLNSPGISLLSLQTELTKHYENIRDIINEFPKSIVHRKQILLFPETGLREYYRLVFGRVFFWLFISLCATYLFALGKQSVDNWKEVKQKQYESIQIQNKSENILKSVPKRKALK
jgi:hypothetical protein